MIDSLWRNFLRGEILSLEKKLIQEALDNFFSFAIKNKLSEIDPSSNEEFHMQQGGKIEDFENWIRDKEPVDSIEDVTSYKVH